jgi:excisionase family DNA binding protein
VSRLLSAQEPKTRHQFVTKNKLFSWCFEVCGLRKSKTSKGF